MNVFNVSSQLQRGNAVTRLNNSTRQNPVDIDLDIEVTQTFVSHAFQGVLVVCDHIIIDTGLGVGGGCDIGGGELR